MGEAELHKLAIGYEALDRGVRKCNGHSSGTISAAFFDCEPLSAARVGCLTVPGLLG
jgi:hypothetical protein